MENNIKKNVYITESLYYKAEINTTLEIKYFSKNKRLKKIQDRVCKEVIKLKLGFKVGSSLT